MRLPKSIVQVPWVAAVLLAIFWSDGAVGVYVSLWVLYGLPISYLTWTHGRRVGFILATIAALLLLMTGAVWGHVLASWVYFGVSVAWKTLVYGTLVLLIGALRKREVERVFQPMKAR